MPRETIVTEAPVSDPSDPFWRSLEAAMHRFGAKGVVWEMLEHPPVLEFDLMSFVNRATGATLQIWEDYRATVKYLEIAAPDAEELAAIRATLVDALTPPTRDALLARAKRSRSDPTRLMRAVYAAGDSPDERVIELVTAALGHKHAFMRVAGACGAGILGWRELEGSLRAARDKEHDPHAAEAIRASLGTLGTPQRAEAR